MRGCPCFRLFGKSVRAGFFVSGGELTDFWNFSRNSCACDFCDRSTLLCMVDRAAITGAYAPCPFVAIRL